MAGPGDDEVRARLRELRVFDPERPDFDATAAPDHPAELFRAWLLEAIDAGVGAPHAMTLGTVGEDGRPWLLSRPVRLPSGSIGGVRP